MTLVELNYFEKLKFFSKFMKSKIICDQKRSSKNGKKRMKYLFFQEPHSSRLVWSEFEVWNQTQDICATREKTMSLSIHELHYILDVSKFLTILESSFHNIDEHLTLFLFFFPPEIRGKIV